MSNPKYKIVVYPDFACISPNAVVSYHAEPIDGKKDSIPQKTQFFWTCHNDPATLPWHAPAIVRGPSNHRWENAQWDYVGRHTIVLHVTDPDGTKTKYTYRQWVDTASNILKREFDPKANDKQPGPFQVLRSKELYHQALLNIAEEKPPTAKQKEEHDNIVAQNEAFIGHLKENLDGLRGRQGTAVDAWHMDRERSVRTTLLLWLVNTTDQDNEPTWTLVDWTNPAYRYTTGVYKGSGATHREAIEDVISEWNSDNRYPDGVIRYQFVIPASYNISLEGKFETDGKSFWDEVSSWLDYAALGGAVVAGIVTLVAPVPGSRVISAAIWTSILTSTTAATINIAQRHAEGFGNWKDDTFDGLSIVGNLFAGAGMAWKMGATITSASRLGAKMTKAVLIGQVTTDGIQGVLLATSYISQYNQIMDAPDLSPNDRLNKLLELFRSAAIAGTMTYISIKGSTADLNNLNNNRTLLSKADIENPKTVISLDEPVSSVPIAENQTRVKAVVETEPKHKPLTPEETPNARVPKRKHVYETGRFSEDLEAHVKKRCEEFIKGNSKGKQRIAVATSRSGIDGKYFENGQKIESPDFENLGGKGQFAEDKKIPGLHRNLEDQTFIIADQDVYMAYVKRLFKKNGDVLDPFSEQLIKAHTTPKGKIFSDHDGVPGLHAEVQSVNHVFKELRKRGVDPSTYDLSKIEVATYKIKPGEDQGKRFIACPNCSGILKPPIKILTGRT